VAGGAGKRPVISTQRPSGRKDAWLVPLPQCCSSGAFDQAKEEEVMRNMYEELFGFRRDFDEMFNRILTGKPWAGWAQLPEFKKEFNFTPAVEAYVDKGGKKYVCRVTLPGVEPKDVKVHAQGNLLTIHGERKFTRNVKEVEFVEQEVAYGVFERTLTLPEGAVIDKLMAEYVNGVLEITAPVTAGALPRKIEIKTAAPLAKQIAA
jgi:HSP20 family protein